LQFLIAERARRHVTVALSGDGGDEAFGGYERHVWLPRVARFGRRVPVSLRRLAARAGSAVPPGAWSAAYGVARPLVPSRWRVSHPGDKAHKLAAVLDADGAADIYDRLTSAWSPRDGLLLDGGADRWPARSAPAALPDAEYARFRDLTEYLPGDILTKVDRATMAVGLEARAPLLDYRLIDWTWRLDPGLAARDGRGKWVLREILARHVPRAFVDRPKQGFAVPIGHWLRGPLRSWAEDLLAERRLRARGLLDPDRVRRVWRQHLSGRRNWETRVWVVLMLEAWMDRWRS
jgi:asparagine synthase (glutamine-hydrolysing)